MASDKQVDNQRNLNSETEKTLSLEEELLQVLQKRRGIEAGSLSNQQDLSNVLQDQTKQLKFQNSERNAIRKISDSILSISTRTYAITEDQVGLIQTEKSLKEDQAKLDKNIILLKQQQSKLLNDTTKKTEEEKRLNADIAQTLKEQLDQAITLKQQIGKVEASSEGISKNFGVKAFSKVAEVIKDVPGIGKLAGPLEAAAEGARSMAAGIQDAATSGGKGLTKEKIKQLGLEKDLGNLSGRAAAQKLKGFSATKKGVLAAKAGFKTLGPIIKNAFGPAAILLELVKAFQLIDGESGKIAKQLGVSAAEGRSLVRSSTEAASQFGDIMVSTKDVVAAQSTLNQQFGTAVQFTGQFAAEFASISERTGLSAEAMGLFASNAMISGGTIKDQLTDITAATMELNAQSGISLSVKEIQEGIGKSSKSALLFAGRNTKELANQVYQAKLLGVEQSKVESIADSLLNFEDSIAKELEAELLLGKDLNLEKARQAALDNDLATVASEIKNQVGSAADFQKMNRIEAEALAAAVGMTKEELAGALVEQEKLEAVQKAGFKDVSAAQEAYNKALKEGNLTQELRNDLANAGVLAQFESVTAQEKLAAVTDKLQDLFVSLMEPLMPIFDILIQILEDAINPIMKILSPILKMIGDLLGAIIVPLAEQLGTVMEGVLDVFGGIASILKGDFEQGFKTLGAGFIKIILAPIQAGIDIILGTINTIAGFLGFDTGIKVNLIDQALEGLGLPTESSESTNESANGSAEEAPPLIGLATGGIVTSPTTALIGEGGEPEAVVPLSRASSIGFGGSERTIQLLERLVTAVERGGVVELDGNKVGTALGLVSYKTQ